MLGSAFRWLWPEDRWLAAPLMVSALLLVTVGAVAQEEARPTERARDSDHPRFTHSSGSRASSNSDPAPGASSYSRSPLPIRSRWLRVDAAIEAELLDRQGDWLYLRYHAFKGWLPAQALQQQPGELDGALVDREEWRQVLEQERGFAQRSSGGAGRAASPASSVRSTWSAARRLGAPAVFQLYSDLPPRSELMKTVVEVAAGFEALYRSRFALESRPRCDSEGRRGCRLQDVSATTSDTSRATSNWPISTAVVMLRKGWRSSSSRDRAARERGCDPGARAHPTCSTVATLRARSLPGWKRGMAESMAMSRIDTGGALDPAEFSAPGHRAHDLGSTASAGSPAGRILFAAKLIDAALHRGFLAGAASAAARSLCPCSMRDFPAAPGPHRPFTPLPACWCRYLLDEHPRGREMLGTFALAARRRTGRRGTVAARRARLRASSD